MLSIGEFSRVTRLSVKALRLYHEKGLLIPDKIDYGSKYRYYRGSAVGKALVIKSLKDMGFSLKEIKKIVVECSDDRELLGYVEQKIEEVDRAIGEYREIRDNLALFVSHTESREDEEPRDAGITLEEVPVRWICSIRFSGKYREVGGRFATLSKKCGRYMKGKPFSLYYDGEYKEEGADIEACVPVRKQVDIQGIACRELAGGKAVSLLHRGPYHELNRSYQRLFEYCRARDIRHELPILEQYIKGPGMIFRGNPGKYLTRIFLFYR